MRKKGFVITTLILSVLFPVHFLRAQVRYEMHLKPETSRNKIWLNIQFHNDSQNDIAIPFWGVARYTEFFRFEIEGPDGKILVPPITENFSDPLSAGVGLSRSVPQIGNSPFALVKANQMIECDINLGGIAGRNVQRYYLRQPGEYTINAEFVNPYSTYVDYEAHEVKKMDIAFVGSVKAPQLKVTLTDTEVTTQSQGADLYVPPWVNEKEESNPDIIMDILSGINTQKGIDISENIELFEGLTITGEVFDEKGNPVSNAVLEITANIDKKEGVMYGSIGRFIETKIDRQKSDSDGKYKFTNMPQDANCFSITVEHEDNYIETHVIVPNKNKISKSNVNIVVKEGKILRGKVIDENGTPLPGTRITNYHRINVYGDKLLIQKYPELQWNSSFHSVYTDKNGEFEINRIERETCQFYFKGFESKDFAPEKGHESDGTWVEVLYPEKPKDESNN